MVGGVAVFGWLVVTAVVPGLAKTRPGGNVAEGDFVRGQDVAPETSYQGNIVSRYRVGRRRRKTACGDELPHALKQPNMKAQRIESNLGIPIAYTLAGSQLPSTIS